LQTVKQTIGRRLYKKLKHIRLAFLYTTGFALTWIPFGVLMVLRSFTENPRGTVVNYNPSRPEKKLQTTMERLFAASCVIFIYTSPLEICCFLQIMYQKIAKATQ